MDCFRKAQFAVLISSISLFTGTADILMFSKGFRNSLLKTQMTFIQIGHHVIIK